MEAEIKITIHIIIVKGENDASERNIIFYIIKTLNQNVVFKNLELGDAAIIEVIGMTQPVIPQGFKGKLAYLKRVRF